jgi:hypothetical protein
MRCEDVRERLDDYVDGLLPDDQSVQVEEHVVACTACRREVDALHALLEQTGALPRHILPERDLWSDIEAAATATSSAEFVRRARRFMAGRTLAFSAAAVLLIALGLSLVRSSFEANRPGGGMRSETAGGLAGEIREAEAEYARARQELLVSFAQYSDTLAPETRRVIQENLAIIDGAVAEIRATLTQDPENVLLFRMLVATENQGLTLIRLAVRLSSES